MKFTLQEYLHQDRQWTRACRITHAKYQLSIATIKEVKDFWQQVLNANGFNEDNRMSMIA